MTKVEFGFSPFDESPSSKLCLATTITTRNNKTKVTKLGTNIAVFFHLAIAHWVCRQLQCDVGCSNAQNVISLQNGHFSPLHDLSVRNFSGRASHCPEWFLQDRALRGRVHLSRRCREEVWWIWRVGRNSVRSEALQSRHRSEETGRGEPLREE